LNLAVLGAHDGVLILPLCCKRKGKIGRMCRGMVEGGKRIIAAIGMTGKKREIDELSSEKYGLCGTYSKSISLAVKLDSFSKQNEYSPIYHPKSRDQA
jgi:hypothetical protein